MKRREFISVMRGELRKRPGLPSAAAEKSQKHGALNHDSVKHDSVKTECERRLHEPAAPCYHWRAMRFRPLVQSLGLAFAVNLTGAAPTFAQPVAAPQPATNQPIRVEISIPPAQTHVIGDPTALVWRFTNTSTQALAFMWEGCCRNNGKVEMKRQGPPPPVTGVVPPHIGPGSGIYSPKCEHCKQTRKLGELTVESTVAGPAQAHQFARAVRLAPGATQEFSTRLADWVKAEFTGDYKVRAQYLGVQPKQRPQMPRGVKV